MTFKTLIIGLALLASALPSFAGGIMMMMGGGVASSSAPTYENFTTYTELDPYTVVSVTTDTVTFTALETTLTNTRVYKDKGAGHFSGDFTHRFVISYSNIVTNPLMAYWMIANAVEDIKDLQTASEDSIRFGQYQNKLRLIVMANGADTQDEYTAASSGTYYITVTRDDDAGANSTGQMVAYIRTGSHTGTLVDTLTVDCPAGEQNDYRYIYPLNNYSSGSSNNLLTGTMSYLELNE